LGFDSIPIGLKATIYDPDERSESGIFITINERMWRKTAEQKSIQTQGKKKKKYNTMVPIEENYLLCEILKKCGYKLLIECNVLEEKNNCFEIFGKSAYKEKNYMDSLENLLTMGPVLEFYKNNDPDDL